MEVGAVGIVRFTNLNSSLKGGFIYPPKEIMYASPAYNPSTTIGHEVLPLLKDLLMVSNVHLEIVVLEFPFVLERVGLFF